MPGRPVRECFREIWPRINYDSHAVEILEKSGPFQPSSPRYNYADLIEHMRYSLHGLCTCNPEELPEYHLLEVYDRRRKLNDQLNELEALRRITPEERTYMENHLNDLRRTWEGEFKRYIRELCEK